MSVVQYSSILLHNGVMCWVTGVPECTVTVDVTSAINDVCTLLYDVIFYNPVSSFIILPNA